MQDLVELERRLSAALGRIGKGIEALRQGPVAAEATTGAEALALARDANARHEAEIARLTQALDAQGLELQRMRKTVVSLRETVRALREAAAKGVAEPDQINRSLQAELEAQSVSHDATLAEVEEILSELTPLIDEVRRHA